MAFEDTYPSEQEEFRKDCRLPVFDFFTKELPAEDSDIAVETAGPTHEVFGEPFPTKPAPPITVEMLENPHYRGFTMVLYKGRMVVFFMGRYTCMENGRWVRMTKPFPDGVPSVRSSAKGMGRKYEGSGNICSIPHTRGYLLPR